MRRTFAVALRVLDQLRRDPRTIVLVLAAPLLVVFLLHEVLESGSPVPRIAVVGSDRLAAALKDRADVLRPADAQAAAELLERGEVDATVELDEGSGLLGSSPAVSVDAADPSASAAAMRALREGLADFAQSSLPGFAKAANPRVSYLNGSTETTSFDFLAPVVLCFLVFFFTFILAGIAFLRERASGTLERAFASPLRRRELVAGYMLGFGAVAALQTAVIQLFVVLAYRAPNAAGFLPALAVNLSVAFAALAMGLFLSAFASTEFQLLQFIPLVVVPQVLFAGIFNLRSGPRWMLALSELFPLTYAGRALRDLMIRGRPLFTVLPDIAILCAFGAAFLALAIWGLARYWRG
jgi:ABC-2 type transport system permease protein